MALTNMGNKHLFVPVMLEKLEVNISLLDLWIYVVFKMQKKYLQRTLKNKDSWHCFHEEPLKSM